MLILTPNRRLAAFLIAKYNQRQQAAVWETPLIYPIEAWLLDLWQTCLENTAELPRPLLSPVQQQILWENIIQQSNIGIELLRVNATAKNALQAWKFLAQWQVSSKKLAAYAELIIDTQAFYAWLQSYFSWLETNNYLDFGLMVDKLILRLPELIDKIPQQICLMGVDDLPPQYAALFAELTRLGIHIKHDQIVKPGAEIYKASFASVEQELHSAAQWAAQKISNQPDEIIGIVVPELERHRQKVARIFANHLPTELVNISAPLVLNNYPLIDTALLILLTAKEQINYADFSILLRSPFIKGAEQELNSRAILDRQLREQCEAKTTWSYILSKAPDIPRFTVNLNWQRTAESWVEIIQQILHSWGWPGDRKLTIEESHLITCWQDLLRDYCQLSVVIPEHSFNQCLQYIQRLANETPFLAAETGLTKVHVLGILEAAGIAFDQLWVTGMERDSWPPDAAPNPFIPLELQRAVDMPRSSPQRELKVAKRLTDTLLQGGVNNIIFSYAVSTAEQAGVPSNLIAHLPDVNIVFNNVNNNTAPVVLESFIDNQGVKLTKLDPLGGAEILKLQAVCPFKAYAEKRLKAKQLVEPQLILSAAERGNIVHAVLEQVYAPGSDLINIIQNILTKWQRKLPFTLTENYKTLESARLFKLITRWLEYEKLRAPFTVAQVEQKALINVGPLLLNLRVDRIDKLNDGSGLIIIDYKTGICDTGSWFKERIIEPQVLIYTLAYAEQLVAVCIANLRPDDLKFRGVAAVADILPDVRVHSEDWQQQLITWRENLTKLAEDFTAGIATVDPYSAQTCCNCNLQALCRIYDC